MSSSDDGPVGRREVAYRLFAAEYDDADLDHSDSDEERAPNYVVTPTGARVNRLFVVGVLTEVEPVSDDVLRARVVDPTGAFVAYAGQYQPEAVAFLEDAEIPSFVSLTGKARTFSPDDSDRVFTSVRPESVTTVDAETRDRWTVQAAEHTLARIATMAAALEREVRGDALEAALRDAGVSPGLASGVALAIDHYGTTPAYLSALREQAVAAAELVVGDRESVPELSIGPADQGPVSDALEAAPAVTGTLTSAAEITVPPTGAEPTTDEAPEPSSPEEPSEPAEADEPPVEEAEANASTADEPPVEEVESGVDVAEAPDPPDGTSDDEPAPESPGTDDLGDFDGGEVPTTEESAEPVDEQYDLDESERAEVEEEFGTEFSTGSEVGEPGEAGIEPETEPPTTEAAEDSSEAATSEDDEPAEDEGATDETAAADLDLEDVVVETMGELDDGDGVGRGAVIDAVTEAHEVNEGAVEEAIQDALMGGRCYEPADGTLKAI